MFGTEDRRPADTRPGKPLSGMGYVKVRGGRGTGFMVGRCHALTNYHNVERSLNRTVTFGLNGASFETVVLAHGGGTSDRNDWAILELQDKDCLPRNYVIPTINLTDPEVVMEQGRRIRMAGYPFDRATDRMWLEPDCRITALRQGMILHNCSQANGNSGSAIFMQAHDSAPAQVIAITAASTRMGESHNTVDEDTNKHFAYAVPMIGIIDQLRANVPDLKVAGRPTRPWPPETNRSTAAPGTPPAPAPGDIPTIGTDNRLTQLQRECFARQPGLGASRACRITQRLLTDAAGQGDVAAMVNLGIGYERGLFGVVNYEAASQWYKKAGRENSPEALYNLALLHLHGKGRPASEQAALTLLDQAARLGDDQAEKLRHELRGGPPPRPSLKDRINDLGGPNDRTTEEPGFFEKLFGDW